MIDWFQDNHLKVLVVASGLLITFLATNYLITKLILSKREPDPTVKPVTESQIRAGRMIGKCENIIIVVMVLAGELTGLALIFGAKNIARQRSIAEDSEFFLAGTILNFTVSLVLAFCIKGLLTFC